MKKQYLKAVLTAVVFLAVAYVGKVRAGPVVVAPRLPLAPTTQLSACALNGTCTFTIEDAGRFSDIWMYVGWDYTATTGNLTFTCTDDPGDGTEYTPAMCDGAATCTLSDSYIFVYAVSTSDLNFSFNAGSLGLGDVTCTVTLSGAGATDKVTVKTRMVTQ